MKKTKIILTAILLAASTWLAKSQTCPSNSCNIPACEMVCNGGFESYSSLPSGETQIARACGWYNALSSTTPDYFHTSATGSTVLIPCNFGGTESERNSLTGYAGVYIKDGASWHERIATQLTSSVVGTSTYALSFWVSLSDNSTYNDLGAFGFCVNQGSYTLPYGNPIHILNTSSVTPYGWTKLTYTFCDVGMSPADYLVIGDFSGFSPSTYSVGAITTSTSTCAGYNYTPPGAMHIYYYIDDVSLVEILPTSVVASHTTGCAGESFSLTASGASSYSWTPSTGLSCTNCANPVSTTTAQTVYTVVGTSTASCLYSPATITISPNACCTNTASGNITLRDVRLVASTNTTVPAWSSLTSGSAYTGDIAAPLTGTITNTLTIIGSFSISTPVTFYQSHIGIDADVSIKQYSTTIIDHSFLYGPCGLWEGILSYTSLDVTNSWIEDAYTAVAAGYGLSITTHPRLYVDNVLFNKNYIGIAVGTTSMDPGTFKVKGCIFSSRAFSPIDYITSTRYTTTFSNIAAKAPKLIKGSSAHSIANNAIRSHTAIAVVALTSNTTTTRFVIGDVSATSTTNASYTNRFDYLDVGIYNERTQLDIFNNGFSNMINAGGGTEIGAVYHNDHGYHTTSTKIGSLGGAIPTANYKNIFGFNTSGTISNAVTAENGGVLNVSYNDFITISLYGVNVKTWNAANTSTETVLVSNNSFSTTSYAFYANNNQSITAAVTSNTLVQPASTYTSTGYGVYINEINKPANAAYLVNANNFSQGLNSVYIINTKNARVIDNIVQVKKPSSTSIFNSGITMDNDENTFVKGNTISCNPTNSSSFNTFGIFQNASIGSTLKCNTIYSVSACIKAQSTCSPTTMYFNSLNNTSGNDACLFGLWLDNNATFGDIGYKNGSTWEMSDDIWGDFLTGSGGADTKCQVGSNPTPGTPYKIYYDNSNSGPKPLSLYQPQVNLSTPSFSDASQSFSATPNGTTNSQGCTETSRLMNSSLANPGRNGGNSLTGTQNNPASLNVEPETGDNNNSQVSRFRKKQIILKTGGSNAREITTNDDAFWLVDSLMTAYTQSKNSGVISSAINNNAAIIPQNTIEQNQKDFNGIYCIFLQADSLVSPDQIQTIQNMAALCPFTDGLAVYQARALIRNWDDSTRYYNVCENNVPDLGNSSRLANQSEQASDSVPTVYPNPTNGNLMVKSSCKDCIFEVYDLIGKKVMSQKLNEAETKVDISSLNSGTYLYKIMQNGALLKADKLILTR